MIALVDALTAGAVPLLAFGVLAVAVDWLLGRWPGLVRAVDRILS